MLLVLKTSLGVGEIGKGKKGKVKIMFNFDDMFEYTAHIQHMIAIALGDFCANVD